MPGNRSTMIGLFLFAVLFLVSGCVSIDENEKIGTLEKDVSGLNQLIRDKEAKIEKLQELVDDQQQQLRDLNDKLLECNKRKIEKLQPNLK